jgi:hypothetical protein
MYDPRTLEAELSLQQEIQGNAARQATFKDFAVIYGQFWVFIAMIGDQKSITMIHMLGVFYSLKQATNAYQSKVLTFIGDRRAMKEPTPICLPQTKAWQWFTGKASKDAQSFEAHYANPATQGTWWRPTGETMDIKAPYLLSLPNALVELLRDQNTLATPADILSTINEVTANARGGLAEELWSTVQDWCICAGQAGQNNKSLLSIKLDSVSIDDDKFVGA